MVIKSVSKVIKPFLLASLLIAYLVGAGLVQYVRGMQSWTGFVQGLFFILFIALSVESLAELQLLSDPRRWSENVTYDVVNQIRWALAILAATLLAAATSLLIGWMIGGLLNQGLLGLVIMAILAGVVYYFTRILPKFTPYQVFSQALLFAVLPPAMGFFIQSNDIHWMLTLTVLPMIPGFIANQLLHQIKHFSEDQKGDVKSFVNAIGWERGMVFHNALILLEYVMFALVAVLGFPWFLVWQVFLTLPIGLLEIWLMERTRRGGRVLWRAMTAATLSIYFIPMYLMGLAFWIR